MFSSKIFHFTFSQYSILFLKIIANLWSTLINEQHSSCFVTNPFQTIPFIVENPVYTVHNSPQPIHLHQTSSIAIESVPISVVLSFIFGTGSGSKFINSSSDFKATRHPIR